MTRVPYQINHREGRSLCQHSHPSSYPISSSFPYVHLINLQKASSPSPSPPASSSNKISPAILFIIIILALIVFISGLLHLLVRFLVKQNASSSSTQSNNRYPIETSSSDALQRQLRQLFHLHDSGLDPIYINALPIFLYKEIVGAMEPFDCAVCLCEFRDVDKLRVLPMCSHAFHITCIDQWLLSNSTCPLCRGAIFVPGLAIENPLFYFLDSMEEESLPGEQEDRFSLPSQKPVELEEGKLNEKRVFSVRLGKFKNINGCDDGAVTGIGASVTTKNVSREEGESSSSCLDARRCYSMGSYQYVVGDVNLQVAFRSGTREGDGKGLRRRGLNGNSVIYDSVDGQKLCERSKGESFSVSKIWQWPNKKGKVPMSSDGISLDSGLPWIVRSAGVGDT